MIIVEGIDRSGKSVLCKYLSSLLHIPLIRMRRPGDFGLNIKKEFSVGVQLTEVYLHMTLSGFNFIMDRAYPSELVYAPLSGRPVNLDYYIDVDSQLQTRASIFYIQPSINILESRWVDCGYDVSYILKLISQYDKVFNSLKVPVFNVAFDLVTQSMSIIKRGRL